MTIPHDAPTQVVFTVRGGETCDAFGFEALDSNGAPIDVSGFAARMEVRAADGTLLFALDTSDGTMVNGGLAGTFIGAVSQSVPNISAAYSFETWVEDTLGSNHPWWVGSVVVALSLMGELP